MERWEHIEELVDQALQCPPDQRSRFLANSNADTTILEEVRSLLQMEAIATGLFDPLGEKIGALVPGKDTPPVKHPTQIGTYRIIRPIGRGGMGQVYLALREDDQFRQHVAIKVLKRGMDTDDVLHRFRTERQILAALDHPAIATLLDGGMTDDGRPYFVMRYIEGESIHTYCDTHCLSIEERLHLFVQVCDAVAYAHRNLVVHRDIKPSNILVTHTGQPVLVDFGIAKLLNPGLSAHSLALTRASSRLMTPEYASPEQVQGTSITTASDVYALGILLYEILTGHHPYDLSGKSLPDVARTICELDPPRPSTVVSRPHHIIRDDGRILTLTPAEISQARGLDPHRLMRQLRGDLDMIVLKALRKEPTRRYRSAEHIGDDIRRYRKGLPVLAQRDTIRYRTAKFIRRHRYTALATSIALLLLIAFSITMAVQSVQLREERDRAEQVATAMLQFYKDLNPLRRDVTIHSNRDLLDRSAQFIQENLQEQPETQARLLTEVGTAYRGMNLFPEAEALLRDAIRLYETHALPPLDHASSLSRLGALHYRRGNYEDAIIHFTKALTLQKTHTVPPSEDLLYTLQQLGRAYSYHGLAEQGRRTFDEAVAYSELHYGANHAKTASFLTDIARLHRTEEQYQVALTHLEQAFPIQRQMLGLAHPDIIESLREFARTYEALAAFSEADRSFEQATALSKQVYTDVHWRVALVQSEWGLLKLRQGDLEAAEHLQREALAMRLQIHGPEHIQTTYSLMFLGRTLVAQGLYTDAEHHFRQALATRRNLLDANNWLLPNTERWLGYSLAKQGRFAEAEPLLVTAYAELHSNESTPPIPLRQTRDQLTWFAEVSAQPELAP